MAGRSGRAPIVQHRETIPLPELTGPGAWLVDLVGGQVSARALIRKGRLVAFPERTADGQSVRVFDETGKPVPTASIALGRETFTADPNGLILIPNAPNQPVTRGIVKAGKLAPVLEVPFLVPADPLKLTLTLRGTVTPATGGDPVKLSADSSYEINADLKESRVGTSFFSPTTEGHRLEFRGRNGEPLPSRAITLLCSRLDYEPNIKLQVRTDAMGRVDLGKLDTIDYLEATGTDIADTLYDPDSRTLDYATSLHFPTNSEIRLPLEKPAAVPDRLAISLLETLGEKPIRDHFDKIAVDAGQRIILGLPPGDFKLIQGDSTTEIRISAGVENGGLLISNTRILPRHSPLNPTNANANANAEQNELKIQLRDAGPGTRVTVVGKRYQQVEWNPGAGLYPFARPIPNSPNPCWPGNPNPPSSTICY